jgi:hypothetical protein
MQMNAMKIGASVSLVFSTVLDQVRLGLVDEDEEVQVNGQGVLGATWNQGNDCNGGRNSFVTPLLA